MPLMLEFKQEDYVRTPMGVFLAVLRGHGHEHENQIRT